MELVTTYQDDRQAPTYNSKLHEIAARHRHELHPAVIREIREVEREPRLPAHLRRLATEVLNGRKPWGGRRAVPLSELYEDPSLCAPPKFDLPPYTAKGRITLLTVGPKAGKTTFAAHYAVRAASSIRCSSGATANRSGISAARGKAPACAPASAGGKIPRTEEAIRARYSTTSGDQPSGTWCAPVSRR